MSKLIVKSPYIKCGKAEKASGFMKYIATRDGVEKLPINGFVQYIGTRPRAEKLGKHGLFGDDDTINLEKTMAEIDNYKGNIWTHIFSLKREDAERLGYNNAKAWRDLVRTHRNEIAEAMNIPVQNFRWVAAYHNELEHPHIHMMAWSSNPKEGYLKQKGIQKIKSKLTNDIFKQEMLHLYENKTQIRNELVIQARKEMLNLAKEMKNGLVNSHEIEELLLKLSKQLETFKGKKSYAYLKKTQKDLVDEIVNQFEKIPIVANCYEQWQVLQGKLDAYYNSKPYNKKSLSQEKTFQSIKNIIINEAFNLHLDSITFEDDNVEIKANEQQANYEYHKFKEIILNDDYYLEYRDEAVEDMKKLADNGNRYAQYFMGNLYQNSDIVIPDDELAIYYFEQAANSGIALAEYQLGKIYLLQNKAVCINYLHTAFNNGIDHAGYLLAKKYLKGKIVPKNTEKAINILKISAGMNNQHSQYLLGKLLYKNSEKEQAIYWLSKASAQGNVYAEQYLSRVETGYMPSCMLAVTRLLHGIANLFQDNSSPKKENVGMTVDKKLRMKIKERKMAHGHKYNDHEEYQGYNGQTM